MLASIPMLALAGLASLPLAAAGAAPYVRAHGDRFEIVEGREARPVFFRGVNIGAGMPGRFPGEFALGYEDYRRYLRFARELRANAVRLYTLHPPAFYRALRDENLAHPESPIWLFQEVWTELPESNDFRDSAFTTGFVRAIRLTIDAVHGRADVRPRPGHASGRYDADASRWIAGWLLGREWEPYTVRDTERRHPGATEYRGRFFEVRGGTAMETWLAAMCDSAAMHEADRYGLARAVSFVTWPTLDVMRHPTEHERGGVEAIHDEDAYSVDPRSIRPLRAASPEAAFLGYFTNYHVYPYYPDFMNLDPGYGSFRDRHGVCRYAGYLRDLKKHTRGLPLLIGEYGVPSSRGVAHLQPEGIHHGGATEEEQGARGARLLEDIAAGGCAGALLFSLFDEWFKVSWLVGDLESPRERDPLWHNLLDPEEGYGLIGFDPPPRIRVDGSVEDWAGIAPYASAPESMRAGSPAGNPLRALYAASDQSRFYLRLDLEPRVPGRPVAALGIALDVLDPDRGDTRLPLPLDATWSRGAEYVVILEIDASRRPAGRRRAELFVDRSLNWSGWSRIRTPRGFTRNTAPFRTEANADGRFVPMIVETNRERVGRDGTVYPARYLDWGRLSHGSEWRFAPDGSSVEIAIPWGLLGVGDPSSRSILDDLDETPEIDVTRTAGFGLLAWATSARGWSADSLGPASRGALPAKPEQCHFLGPAGTTKVITGQTVRVTTPRDRSWVWNAWDQPITKERVKSSATSIRHAFEGMEARESRNRPAIDARGR